MTSAERIEASMEKLKNAPPEVLRELLEYEVEIDATHTAIAKDTVARAMVDISRRADAPRETRVHALRLAKWYSTLADLADSKGPTDANN